VGRVNDRGRKGGGPSQTAENDRQGQRGASHAAREHGRAVTRSRRETASASRKSGSGAEMATFTCEG
jgi:hypothetical protein